MNKKLKNASAFILALAICGGSFNYYGGTIYTVSTPAGAASFLTETGKCGPDCTYELQRDTGVLTITGSGPISNYTADDAAPWDEYAEDVRTVIIDSGITYVGNYAFDFCWEMTSVSLPDTVTKIGESAFSSCLSLKSIVIPESVTDIGEYAFSFCSALVSVNIPEKVTVINDGLFWECDKLKSINIPSGVKTIGYWAFDGCDSLRDVYYSGTHESWKMIDIGFDNDPLHRANLHFSDNTVPDITSQTVTTVTEVTTKKQTERTTPAVTTVTTVTEPPESVTTVPETSESVTTATVTSEQSPEITTRSTLSPFDPFEPYDPFDPYFPYDPITPPVSSEPAVTEPQPHTRPHESSEPDSGVVTWYTIITQGPSGPWETSESDETTVTKRTTVPEETTVTKRSTAPEETKIPETTRTSETSSTVSPSPSKSDKSIIFGKDDWNFTNSDSYFGYGDYYISSDYYNVLLNKLSNKEKSLVSSSKQSQWGGSCYGLASLSVLAKENIFNVSSWQSGASYLHDLSAPNNDKNESIINYYYLLQCTDEVQQEITNSLYESESAKISELVKLCSNVPDGASPVLLCFYGYFYGYSYGGHAVTAYGTEYGSWIKDGVSYNGRILIYDNNNSGFSDDFCLYFNSSTGKWTIPYYSITSSNGGQLGLITNNINLINNKGYFGSSVYQSDKPYIAVMQAAARDDFSVCKVEKKQNSWTISSSSGENELKYFYGLTDNSTASLPDVKIAAKDARSSYRYEIPESDSIEVSMSYENSMLSASADKGQSVIFSYPGQIEMTGKDSDFRISVTNNEGFYSIPWYEVSASGHHSDTFSIEDKGDGYILSGDNLVNVMVSASGSTSSPKVKFTTDKNSVFIYSIDENTIGVKEDSDGDGTFDTVTAQTNHKADINEDGAVSAADLISLKMILFGESQGGKDVNGDGSVNVMDLVSLRNLLIE